MAKYYQECGPDVYEVLAELIEEYRHDLKACGARISLLFITSLEGDEPALKHHGQPVAGRCHINGLQDRAEGKADATITLDVHMWNKRSPEWRKALLHHELTHIARWDRSITPDPLDRPTLKPRHGDWENDGFFEIAAIYGDDAPEVRYLRAVEERLGQGRLPFRTGKGDLLDVAEPSEPVADVEDNGEARPKRRRKAKTGEES